ncbi:MAG TPA: radical SAM family heme chaperone HemW [Bacteroidales bacterium]|nr:radical SAM family heme chaperone HemW [Bacteroidales bacterium]
MAGIYIHIPFCKKKCHYCNFFSTPSTKRKDELIKALHKELCIQKHYTDETIGTVYFGGGTPSLLASDEINSLTDVVSENYILDKDAEITLEVNPDDISAQKVRELKTTAVNRISIGVQSFFDQDLNYLNRIHTSAQAEYAVKALQDAGFANMSIDLIYGIPSLGMEHWKKNLLQAIGMQVPHISAYALTIEPDTNMDVLIRQGKREDVSDEETVKQFRFVMNLLRENNYLHYEISNFCLPGYESKHNKAYWENIPYLGIGPSAHSYNKISRQWNSSNLNDYLFAIADNKIPCETETLTADQRYNEYVMTSLRTNRGVSLQKLKSLFGEVYPDRFQEAMKQYEGKAMLAFSGDTVCLTDEGKLFADRIIADFFAVD